MPFCGVKRTSKISDGERTKTSFLSQLDIGCRILDIHFISNILNLLTCVVLSPLISRVSGGAAARKASADAFLEKKLSKKLCRIKSKVFCPTFFQKSRRRWGRARRVNRILRSSGTHCKIRVTLKTLFNMFIINPLY